MMTSTTTPSEQTGTKPTEDWLETNWVEINGGGVVTQDQIDEMNRRIKEYEELRS